MEERLASCALNASSLLSLARGLFGRFCLSVRLSSPGSCYCTDTGTGATYRRRSTRRNNSPSPVSWQDYEFCLSNFFSRSKLSSGSICGSVCLSVSGSSASLILHCLSLSVCPRLLPCLLSAESRTTWQGFKGQTCRGSFFKCRSVF